MPLTVDIQKLWDQKFRDESVPFPVDGSPDALNLADGSVTTAKLADASVTSAKIADATITDTDISASAAIAVSKLAAGSDTQVLTTSGSTVTWAAAGSLGASAAALGWYDTRDYGAKCDLRGPATPNVTASNPVIPITTGGGAAVETGKLVRIRAAGTLLFSGTDGAMTTGTSATNNRFTSSGSTFTTAVVGRFIVIDGHFTAKILGVESATQLRLNAPSGGAFSGATWRICEDHYTSVSTATAGVSITVANAPVTSVTGAYVYWATDDAAAIQAAVTAAEAATGGDNGNVVYHHGMSGIGAPIYLQKPTQLVGSGARGLSSTLAQGRSQLHLLAPHIRGVVGGGSDTGMGYNGAMTSGSAVLTDPEANFVSGDVGKNIKVYGAGTQTGSTDGVYLSTTILSRQSATQVTLNANAGTTVTHAFYSYATNSGFAGGLVGPGVHNLHIIGGPGQKAGVHLMNCSGLILSEVTCSDFGSSTAFHIEGGPGAGFMNQVEWRSCSANDSRVGLKQHDGTIIITGHPFIDGNSNRVDCYIPEAMTIGVDANNVTNAGFFKIQAVGTGAKAFGSGGSSGITGVGWAFENISVGFDLATDASSGGQHHWVGFHSMGNSNAGGGSIMRLRTGARARLERGYHLDNDMELGSLIDATAKLIVVGENIQKAGPVSDGDFFNLPADGTLAVDTTNKHIQVREGGQWGYATLTGLASFVRLLGNAQIFTSGTSLSITLGGGVTIPVGHHIIVACGYGQGVTSAITFSDSKSNTYATDAHADKTTGDTAHIYLGSAKVTTQLTTGDTITATGASTINTTDLFAFEFAGMATSQLDQASTGATGTGTSVATNSITTTQASEILITATYNAGVSLATQTPGAGWTTIADEQNTGTKRLSVLQQGVFATSTYSGSQTLSMSNDWATVVASYKAA